MLCYKDFLKNKLLDGQRVDARLSLRSFASRIGVDSSTLSRVLNGERELPLYVAYKIKRKLGLEGEIADQFITSVLERVETNRKAKRVPTQGSLFNGDLDSDRYAEVISNHTMLSILALLNGGAGATLSYIVEKLALEEELASQLLKRLYHLGLVGFKEGKFLNLKSNLYTKDNVPSASIRKSHANLLRIASQKLEEVPVEERDFTSLKIKCNSKCIKEIRKEIRRFQKKVLNITATKFTGSDILELAIQVFPHTQTKGF